MRDYHKDYTLSIYNNPEEVTVEIECEHEDMLDVIMYITNAKYGLMSRFSTS